MGRSPKVFGRCAPTCGVCIEATPRSPTKSLRSSLPGSTGSTQMFEMRRVPTDLGGAGFWSAAKSCRSSKHSRKSQSQAPSGREPPPVSAPHLLPCQRRSPAPGHLGGEGSCPGWGAEVLRGDGQELGDTELLGHGGREAETPGLPEPGAGNAALNRAGLAAPRRACLTTRSVPGKASAPPASGSAPPRPSLLCHAPSTGLSLRPRP